MTQPVILEGAGRLLPGAGAGESPVPLRLTLDADSFAFALGGGPERHAAYRDLALVALQAGTALLVLGTDRDAPRILCERFGAHLGRLVAEMRERRLRQRLADRFVELPGGEAVELVEYEEGAGGSGVPGAGGSGVAQLAYHGRGFVLAPLDERQPWRVVPRGQIGRVSGDASTGSVEVEIEDGPPIRLVRLGPAAVRHAARLAALRDGALADAAAIVESLVPDAPFAARDRASSLLVDGRPAAPEDLGPAWGPLEAAVQSEPTFAGSYRSLVDRAGGPAAHRWLALAPEAPGLPRPKAWFFVALPGNLVAMELVSEGAHATYCFAVLPRSSYGGDTPAGMLDAYRRSVASLSEALIGVRFLREPIGLTDAALAAPAYARYRLAIAALPSLADARRMFVARLVHDDRWAAALDDLVAWHGACRDDAATWPGRVAQEAVIAGMSGSESGAAAG